MTALFHRILFFFLAVGVVQSGLLLLCLHVALAIPLSDFKLLLVLILIPVGTHLLEGWFTSAQLRNCLPNSDSDDDEVDSSTVLLGCVNLPDWMLWAGVQWIREEFEELAATRQTHWAQLLGRLSHELNTNIHAILGAVQIMSDRDMDRDFVRIVSHAGSVMANIVSDFLDFSLCEEGQLALSAQPFSIASIVQHLGLRFETEAKRMNITLDFTVPDTVLAQQIVGDFDRLCQVLTNLICNSFMAVAGLPNGNVTVSVELLGLTNDDPSSMVTSATPSFSEARFVVADNGVGIAPDDQEKLFRPFSRVSRAANKRNTEPSPGCGLGLCICRHLVTLMGGTIVLQSSLTDGTDVTFTLPMHNEFDSPTSGPSTSLHVTTLEASPSHISAVPTGLWPGALLHANVHTRLSRVPNFPTSPRTGRSGGRSARTGTSGGSKAKGGDRRSSQSLPSSAYSARTKRSSLSRGLSSYRSNLTARSGISTNVANLNRSPLPSGLALPGQTLNACINNLSRQGSSGAFTPSHRGPPSSFRASTTASIDPISSAREGGPHGASAASAYLSSGSATALQSPPPGSPTTMMHHTSSTTAFLQIPLLNIVGKEEGEDGGDTTGPSSSSAAGPQPLPPHPPSGSPFPTFPIDSDENVVNSFRAFTDLSLLRRPQKHASCASLPSRVPPIPAIQIDTEHTGGGVGGGGGGGGCASPSTASRVPLLCFIVDDNTINLLLLKKMLLKVLDCEVCSFCSGIEALPAIRTRDLARRAVVLTDIHMPEMTGIELSSELRRHWSPQALPIFGVTADYTGPMRDDCLQNGMQAVIAKPMTCNGLLEVVRTTLVSIWGDLPAYLIKTPRAGSVCSVECPIPSSRGLS